MIECCHYQALLSHALSYILLLGHHHPLFVWGLKSQRREVVSSLFHQTHRNAWNQLLGFPRGFFLGHLLVLKPQIAWLLWTQTNQQQMANSFPQIKMSSHHRNSDTRHIWSDIWSGEDNEWLFTHSQTVRNLWKWPSKAFQNNLTQSCFEEVNSENSISVHRSVWEHLLLMVVFEQILFFFARLLYLLHILT